MVLPCVPVTRAVVPGHQPRQHHRAQHDRDGARRASTSSGLVLVSRRVVITAVGPPGSRSSADASCPMLISAPRARSARTPRTSLASDPETSAPRSSRMRAMPDAGAADADHVHPGQLVGQRRGAWGHELTSVSRHAPATQSDLGHPLGGVVVPDAGGGGRHRGQSRCVGEQSADGVGHELRGQIRVIDEQAAAGLHHGQRVESLLTVPIGSGTYTRRRQACRPTPRPPSSHLSGTRPDRPRHRPDPSDQAGHRHRRWRVRIGRGQVEGVLGTVGAAPTPLRAASAGAAADTARFSDCAPWDPPKTSSATASSAKPKCACAVLRSPPPDPGSRDRRTHRHSHHLGGQTESGTAARTRRA